MSWSVRIRKGIGTPRGVYTPKTDNLTLELVEAAKFAGIDGAFAVKIDGHYVDDPSHLQTNSIAALIAAVSIVEVEPHDTAANQ